MAWISFVVLNLNLSVLFQTIKVLLLYNRSYRDSIPYWDNVLGMEKGF